MDRKNNRSVERFDMRVPVKVSDLDEQGQYLSNETKDISSGGVFIESKDIDLSAGSRVEVELTLTVDTLKELFQVSNQVLLKVEGRVTRATEQGIAVKFSNNYSITPTNIGES